MTNLDNPTNPVVYYGNDILANGFNTAENATNIVSVDAINNVQNVFIPQPVGTNYTVTVIGREVNVNAVSAQTNLFAGPPNGAGVYAPNVVQDYALVISCGDAFTVTDNGIVSNPTGDQDISIIATTNTANPLFNQFVGANSPVLNTNTVSFTSNTAFGGNAVDTLACRSERFCKPGCKGLCPRCGADRQPPALLLQEEVQIKQPHWEALAGLHDRIQFQ